MPRPNIKIVILAIITMCLYSQRSFSGIEMVSNAVLQSKYFTARESELKQISMHLSKGEGVASIIGVAGIGKTQLARKYAELNQHRYNIIWFFNCKRNLTLQFQELAKQINIGCNKRNCKVSENPELVVNSLSTYLIANQSWLLVFDNYTTDSGYGVIEPFNEIAQRKNKHLIFVSRKKDGLKNSVILKPFARVESVNLISSMLSNTDHETNHNIAAMLMDYPLALSKVASFLRKNHFVSYNDLRIMLTASDKTINLIYQDEQSGYFNDGQTIEKMIIHYLHSLSAASAKLLIYSALLDNGNLSKPLLEALFTGNPGNNTEKREEFLNALLELNQNSLIECKQGGAMSKIPDDNFEMHDFLQKEIIKYTKGDMLDTHLRELLQKVNDILPEDMSEIGLLQSQLPSLLENLEALLENAMAANVTPQEQINLRKHLLLLYFYNNDYKKVQLCLAWFKNALPKIDLSQENSRVILAQFYLFSGQYNDFMHSDYDGALSDYEAGLKLLRGLEEQKYEIIYTLHTVKAQTLFEHGQLQEALNILPEAEVIIKKYPQIRNAGLFYFVKAYVALGAGDLKGASESVEDLFKVEGHLPKNVFSAPTYFLKAEILSKSGAFKESYQMMCDLLEILSHQEEEHYQLKPIILRELSRAALKHGKHQESREHIDSAIHSLIQYNLSFAKQEDIESSNGELATLYHVKADIAFAEKKYAEALSLYQKSIGIYETRYKALETDRMSELYSRAAEMALKLGDQFFFKFYLERQEKYFGVGHHRTTYLYGLML